MNRPRRFESFCYSLAVLLVLFVAYFAGRLTGAADMVAELVQDAPDPKTAEQVRALAKLEFGRVAAVVVKLTVWGFLLPVAVLAIIIETVRLSTGR